MLNGEGLVITELMARNDTVLHDQDWDYADWVEIHNPTDAAVSLDGCRLTDDTNDLTKWPFPDVSLDPGEFLVVFASGKDRRIGGEELHTNFRLSGGGEYLALVDDNAVVVHEYDPFPAFPEETPDVSYGLLRDQETFFADPTPGLPNSSVFITELMAINSSTIQDEDLDYSDWIELHNPTDTAVSLNGWYLTDDGDDLDKWQLPGVSIEPDEHLIVFASGKNRSDPAGELHTNFQLADGGGVVALVDADGATVWHQYAPYPQPYEDISYGLKWREADRFFDLEYFAAPTAGQPNQVTFLDQPTFSEPRGFYEDPIAVAISTTPGAVTRYATDGSTPTEGSPEYTVPININTTTTLRAAAFKLGFRPSVATHTYIYLNDVLTQPAFPQGFPTTWGGLVGDYEMDPDVVDDYSDEIKNDLLALPTMSVVFDQEDLFGELGIYTNANSVEGWERPVSVELVDGEGQTMFQADVGARIHGALGAQMYFTQKFSFRLYFRDDYGLSESHYPLFGEAATDEFERLVLRAGSNDCWAPAQSYVQGMGRATYLNDRWVADTQAVMGGLAPHGTRPSRPCWTSPPSSITCL
jgi:hypothetical protein